METIGWLLVIVIVTGYAALLAEAAGGGEVKCGIMSTVQQEW